MMKPITKNLWQILHLIYLIIFRDLVCAILFLRYHLKLKWFAWKNKVYLKFFDENVHRYKHRTAIIYKDQYISFLQVSDFANKVSNWLESGLQIGCDEYYEDRQQMLKSQKPDIPAESSILTKIKKHQNTIKVGLMFSNIPEISSFMIGIYRVRCAPVLFNTNHRGDILLNAFEATNCKLFVFEAKFLPIIQEVANRLPDDVRFFIYDRSQIQVFENSKTMQPNFDYKGLSRQDLESKNFDSNSQQFAKILHSYPSTPVRKRYPYKMDDVVLYIFTSGTSGGKIKAAGNTNYRVLTISLLKQVIGFKTKDNIYVCIPCYHGMGCLVGVLSGLINGFTVTLAEKFSATNFWKDCYVSGCTIAMYIGEICRFLLSKPTNSYERKHQLRSVFGVGMNKEVWTAFKDRFKIKQIYELYSSTEGNANLVNYMGEPGSCGFIPYYFGSLCRILLPSILVKVDPITLELNRGPDGLCELAKPGEIAMMVGQIKEDNPFAEFSGYTSVKESSKKIVRNILKIGDYAFLSGDLFQMDFFGNLYFHDRTGDTFRWRGENVSTTEIENIAGKFLNHGHSIVYGVEVPKNEGRAGMMATNDKTIDLDKFYKYMKTNAPDYAIPKFIRITDDIQTTATQKYLKYPLREAGFDLTKMKSTDQLYYFDKNQQKYVPLDKTSYDNIKNGSIQF